MGLAVGETLEVEFDFGVGAMGLSGVAGEELVGLATSRFSWLIGLDAAGVGRGWLVSGSCQGVPFF